MSNDVRSIEQLEACIGAAGLPVKMKIIDHVDRAAADWIAASTLAFVGFGGGDGPRVTLAGGAAGFATAPVGGVLQLPKDALDDPDGISVGQGAGLLFLAPGVGETLRANGRVASVDDRTVGVAVEECFVHCAKALIRSDFWNPAADAAPEAPAPFVAGTRFLALATMDAQGRIDVSPKGDPAGLLVRQDGDRILLAERPGNRLAFGYRNMLEQPRVAVVGLIPGAASVVTFEGSAHLSADEATREAFVVEGKLPLLATVIEGVAPQVRVSTALARAGLWARQTSTPAVDAAATLLAHIKLNKARGATATLLRLASSRGLIESGLKENYRKDLY